MATLKTMEIITDETNSTTSKILLIWERRTQDQEDVSNLFLLRRNILNLGLSTHTRSSPDSLLKIDVGEVALLPRWLQVGYWWCVDSGHFILHLNIVRMILGHVSTPSLILIIISVSNSSVAKIIIMIINSSVKYFMMIGAELSLIVMNDHRRLTNWWWSSSGSSLVAMISPDLSVVNSLLLEEDYSKITDASSLPEYLDISWRTRDNTDTQQDNRRLWWWWWWQWWWGRGPPPLTTAVLLSILWHTSPEAAILDTNQRHSHSHDLTQ